MLGYSLASAFCALCTAFIASFVSSRFSRTIRSRVYGKVHDFSLQEISRFTTGSLITRTTSDVSRVQMMLFLSLQLIFRAPVLAI